MIIAVFDIATVVGWACNRSDGPLLYGSSRMGKHGCSPGDSYVAFEAWLSARLSEWLPEIIVYEAPLLIGRGGQQTAQKLMGLAAIAELVATKFRIPIRQVETATVTKHFTGRGRWPSSAEKKAATVKMCRLRGLDPSDHNAADAVAIHDFAQTLLAGGPLFR